MEMLTKNKTCHIEYGDIADFKEYLTKIHNLHLCKK